MYFSRPTRRMYVGGWVDVPKTGIVSRPTRRMYGGAVIGMSGNGADRPWVYGQPSCCLRDCPPTPKTLHTHPLSHTHWRTYANTMAYTRQQVPPSPPSVEYFWKVSRFRVDYVVWLLSITSGIKHSLNIFKTQIRHTRRPLWLYYDDMIRRRHDMIWYGDTIIWW